MDERMVETTETLKVNLWVGLMGAHWDSMLATMRKV
jgi:hypothetical protein